MSITVVFNKKQYDFPADIKEFVEILNAIVVMRMELVVSFHRCILDSDIKVVDSEEFYQQLKEKASFFIKRLHEKGVYDKSIDEYVFDNEGYREFEMVNNRALSTMARLIQEEAQDFFDGMQFARERAVDNITGSGVAVYTNSATTLMAASLIEYSKLQKQADQADKQYRNELSALEKRTANVRQKKEDEYINRYYLPEAEQAFATFLTTLMDKYFSDLAAVGLFNVDTYKFFNVSKSSSLLEGMTLSANKDAILEQAFLACPFHVNVYLKALELGKLDEDAVCTARKIGALETLENALQDLLFVPEYSDSIMTDIQSLQPVVDALCWCSGKNRKVYYQIAVRPLFEDVVKKYSELAKMAVSCEECRQILDDYGSKILNYDTVMLQNLVKTKIEAIISSENFEILHQYCGFSDLINNINPPNMQFKTKSEIDSFLANVISNNLFSVISRRKNQIIQDEIEKEKRVKREKINKIAIRIITTVILLAIVIGLIISNIPKCDVCNGFSSHTIEGYYGYGDCHLCDDCYDRIWRD